MTSVWPPEWWCYQRDGVRTLDFDALWASQGDPDAFTIVVNPMGLPDGEPVRMPGSMPVGARLHIASSRRRHPPRDDGALIFDLADLEAIARYLVGPEVLDRWLEGKITEEQLTEVVLSILGEYAIIARRRAEAS